MPAVAEADADAPLVTAAVLFESSLGAFVVDLYGADCPAATSELINLCRCKYYNGTIATDVIPDSVMIFSHPVETLRAQSFGSLVGTNHSTTSIATAEVDQRMRGEWQRMQRYSARLSHPHTSTNHPAKVNVEFVPRPSGVMARVGLLLLEVPDAARGASRRLLLTLSSRHLDYLEGHYMVVGEVREGLHVVERLRAAPYERPSNATSNQTVRPTRLIRLKHATVLPTAGTAGMLGMTGATWRAMRQSSEKRSPLENTLRAMGCFQHWASLPIVRAANRAVVQCIRSTLRNVGGETDGETSFVMLPSHAMRGHSETHEDGNDSRRVTGANAEGASDETGDIVSVEYNPHYKGAYLSSDEDTPSGGTRQEREARNRAVLEAHQERLNETRGLMLNLLDGIADATGELRPPENVLFVCKLNPITTGEGLSMCFSQFGRILSAEVVQDKRTGNSLCYGFIEFEDVEGCFRAFQKMDHALIDDHRIHVDFSQSVSKLWAQRQREARKRNRTD